MGILWLTSTQPGLTWPSLQLDTAESLQLLASDMVYSAYNGRVYVSVPAAGGSLSNSIVPIDPMTGQFGAETRVGKNPSKLVVSNDGQWIYVVSNDGNQIDQINLVSGAVALSFSLGSSGSVPTKATDIAIMPGLPGTIAVACGDGSNQQEVRIYDGPVARPQVVSQSWVTAIEFGANASVLYGFDSWTTDRGFYTMAVGASGVGATNYYDQSPFARGSDIAFAEGLVFGTSGGIFDPTTRVMRTPFNAASGPLTVDGTFRRVCYVLPKANYSDNLLIQGFNLDTFLPVGLISLPSPPGYFTGTMIRWGDNGLVYRANTNLIYFLRTSFLPSAPTADLSIRQNFAPAGVSNAVLRCFGGIL